MLELYEDEIPEFDRLVDGIRQMLRDPENTLVDIREKIFYHILESGEIDPEDEDKASKAMTLAFNAIDSLIRDLEGNEMNCKRLMDYLSEVQTYDGYDRLILDFQDFLSEEERERLIEEGKRIFIPEVTEHWT